MDTVFAEWSQNEIHQPKDETSCDVLSQVWRPCFSESVNEIVLFELTLVTQTAQSGKCKFLPLEERFRDCLLFLRKGFSEPSNMFREFYDRFVLL